MTADLSPSLLSRLHDPIMLPDHEIAVGLTFVQGAGHRVGTVTPAGLNHMSAAQARRMARELLDSDQGVSLRAAIDALFAVARRIEPDHCGLDPEQSPPPKPYTDAERALSNMPSHGNA